MNIDSGRNQYTDSGSYKSLANMRRDSRSKDAYALSVQTLRRNELTNPRDQIEFEAALRWFTQHGDKRDLFLLREVRANPPYTSNDILALINRVESRLTQSYWDIASERHFGMKQLSIVGDDVDEDRRSGFLPTLSRAAVLVRRQSSTRGSLLRPAPPLVEKEILDDLREIAQHESQDRLREIAYILGAFGGGASVIDLQQLSRPSCPADVRAEAVDSLGRIGGPEAVATLRQVLAEDRDEMVRAEAVDGLAALVGAARSDEDVAEIEDELRQVARKDLSPYVRERIAKTVS